MGYFWKTRWRVYCFLTVYIYIHGYSKLLMRVVLLANFATSNPQVLGCSVGLVSNIVQTAGASESRFGHKPNQSRFAKSCLLGAQTTGPPLELHQGCEFNLAQSDPSVCEQDRYPAYLIFEHNKKAGLLHPSQSRSLQQCHRPILVGFLSATVQLRHGMQSNATSQSQLPHQYIPMVKCRPSLKVTRPCKT